MIDKEPTAEDVVEVKQEFLGTIVGKVGRQSIFIARHFNNEGQEVYSRASLVPQVEPFIELAEQQLTDQLPDQQ